MSKSNLKISNIVKFLLLNLIFKHAMSKIYLKVSYILKFLLDGSINSYKI